MQELKPCPWCESDNVELEFGDDNWLAVHCHNCGSRAELVSKDQTAATARYNTIATLALAEAEE